LLEVRYILYSVWKLIILVYCFQSYLNRLIREDTERQVEKLRQESSNNKDQIQDKIIELEQQCVRNFICDTLHIDLVLGQKWIQWHCDMWARSCSYTSKQQTPYTQQNCSIYYTSRHSRSQRRTQCVRNVSKYWSGSPQASHWQ